MTFIPPGAHLIPTQRWWWLSPSATKCMLAKSKPSKLSRFYGSSSSNTSTKAGYQGHWLSSIIFIAITITKKRSATHPSRLPASVGVAAQNCYKAAKGAFTGEQSPQMVLVSRILKWFWPNLSGYKLCVHKDSMENSNWFQRPVCISTSFTSVLKWYQKVVLISITQDCGGKWSVLGHSDLLYIIYILIFSWYIY